ncbi:MAG TPA: dihydrofolate reductase family protein [Blastocatellia bacterium]|nr:dihydrofolate reductase family protein [Blastocatellia bacterium]
MRNLVYYIACTADGFIARADGSFDFFPMTGEHLTYIAAEYPETISGHWREMFGVQANNQHFDTVLMGRHTYEVGSLVGFTNPYPHLRQYVVSSTMTESPDAAVQLVTGDPIDLVRSLKQEAGLDIWLCGGARLAGALYHEIDEIILKVNPVVLGTGMPLFQGGSGSTALELTDHKTFVGGVAIHRYRVIR